MTPADLPAAPGDDIRHIDGVVVVMSPDGFGIDLRLTHAAHVWMAQELVRLHRADPKTAGVGLREFVEGYCTALNRDLSRLRLAPVMPTEVLDDGRDN